MENVTKKEADGIGQPCECREDETEKFNVFIQEMVQVVEKYGKQVLQDLDSVAQVYATLHITFSKISEV